MAHRARRRRGRAGAAALLALLLLLAAQPLAAQPTDEPAREMAAMINAARRASGESYLALSPALAEAAQRHAEDIAPRGDPSHTGSDGSTVAERAARAGFRPYPDGTRVSENWSAGSAMDALSFFIQDQEHRDNLLLPIWREIGVGHVAESPNGELWVVVFGAQPGVLPMVIDEGAPRTTSPEVTLLLSQEEAGWDEATFTAATEARAAEADALDGAPWQPWAETLPFTLGGPGERTVVVEYRDAQGRTVRAQDSIFYAALDAGAVPTAVAQFAPTLTATATPTVTPTVTPTATPTVTPTPTATATPAPLFGVIPPESNLPLLGLGVGLLAVAILLAASLLLRR